MNEKSYFRNKIINMNNDINITNKEEKDQEDKDEKNQMVKEEIIW